MADLPLQVGAEVVAARTVPWTCRRHGHAQRVFSGDREALQRCGFVPEPLHQARMRRALRA